MGTDSMQRENAPDLRVYRVADIATILKISRSAAYALVKKGLFQTVRIGTAIRISKQSFDDWLDSHTD